MHRPVIAIIEDDPALQALLQDALSDEGYTTISWRGSAGAHEVLRQAQPDLIILDLWLEHPQAGSMVLGLLAVDPATRHLPVIVCSGAHHLLAAQAVHLAAQGYVIVEKPFDLEALLRQVAHCVHRSCPLGAGEAVRRNDQEVADVSV